MGSFKCLWHSVSIDFFVFIFVIMLAIRKTSYELYNRFPNAARVHQFLRKRELKFYWMNRADFCFLDLVRLYALWIMIRFDKYFPLIDCDRQAAKAQYFHDCGRYSGMMSWHYRYIN